MFNINVFGIWKDYLFWYYIFNIKELYIIIFKKDCKLNLDNKKILFINICVIFGVCVFILKNNLMKIWFWWIEYFCINLFL